MQSNRSADTRPELALRSALHRSGLRFRKNHRVEVRGVAVRPDVVFPARRVAVFVDGCFWHCCPDHGVRPASNPDYWTAKLDRNRVRDELVTAALRSEGWLVVRLWEHTPVNSAVAEVIAALADR